MSEPDDAEMSKRAWKSYTDNVTLLRLWRAGDASAGNELLRRLGVKAPRHFWGMPAADADDLVQRYLIELSRKLPDAQVDERLEAFCATVAARCRTDYWRKKYRAPETFDVETLTLADVGGLTAWRKVSLDEHLGRLLEPLEALSIREFEILGLVLLQGLAVADVAQGLEISPEIVRNTVCRCRQKLKAKFAEDYMQIAK